LAGQTLAGASGRLIALLLAFLFVLSINRFQPGAIDHHNVQLGLDRRDNRLPDHARSPAIAHAVAGFAAAVAIAIGAETTPHIAVIALIVALQWLWLGEPMRAAALTFSLSMASTLTAASLPPCRLRNMALSHAMRSPPGSMRSAWSAPEAFLLQPLQPRIKVSRSAFAALGLAGVATLGLTLLIAPQCLGNPLAGLDPLLKSMWLDNVTEAQSVVSQLRVEPWTSGGFYAVPVLAMALCLWRIRERRQVQAYGVLLAALLLVSWAIALVQVRGAVFSNLLSAIPMAALIADLRARANADPKNLRKGLAFAGMSFAAVPFVWAFVGALASMGMDKAMGREVEDLPTKRKRTLH
jgi:hypothetical protein